MKFEIQCWSGTPLFDKTFNDWDDAEEFLCNHFEANNLDYEENRQEFYIIEV